LELTVRPPDEGAGIAEWLLDLGGTAVEEKDGALVTYLAPPPDLEGFLTDARHSLEDLHPGGGAVLTWRWQAHEAWEELWKRGLGPRRITPHLVVAPSWSEFVPEAGEKLIVLDPGMAFGTAEHATTRGCLRALCRFVEEGSRVADVGAGSGILSIAAACLGSQEILALEMDEASCETALENILRNGVQERVKVRRHRLAAGDPLPEGPFNGVVANLQSHLIRPLLPSFREGLVPGGWLIVSGILEGEAGEVLAWAATSGFFFQEAEEEEGWWTGVFTATTPGP
jgi:ribosomal protein L11 methyltransferase